MGGRPEGVCTRAAQRGAFPFFNPVGLDLKTPSCWTNRISIKKDNRPEQSAGALDTNYSEDELSPDILCPSTRISFAI